MISKMLALQKVSIQASKPVFQQTILRRFLKKEILQKYAQDEGTPVYLKGGFGDKALFMLTAALSVIGVTSGMYTLIGIAFKKK
ncbi:unnamed protein product [Callosobruchus maculatus]|uniref:Uncharacterized protein n=1 Tax=Callosobruchus maculatus TaxID=64391 RepID=A0A653BGK9_CALMS|nr:unnamed protein product [Callosobruchus maculatus]